MEFVDDYERPVLEKYERITPTPLEKKQRVSDTPKVTSQKVLHQNTSLNIQHRYFLGILYSIYTNLLYNLD